MNTETPLAFLRDQELSEAEVKAILERYRRRRSSQLLVPTLALLAALGPGAAAEVVLVVSNRAAAARTGCTSISNRISKASIAIAASARLWRG